MAGGMDWFRWHHGTVTDQKFPLIAKRSGASVAEVIAVWACLLENASMNEVERGRLSGEPDYEAMDCALGMEDGTSLAIYEAFRARALIDNDQQFVSWHRRQPKREREDGNSTERVRAYRERQKLEGNANDDHGTQSNAMERQETPRGEESREEKHSPPPDEPGETDMLGEPIGPDRRKAKRQDDGAMKARFERVYAAYPRKEARKDAEAAFLSLKPDDALAERMVAAIQAQGLPSRWADPERRQFVPMPASWLRKRRWEDEAPRSNFRSVNPTGVCL